jgi:hypothetical protein
LLIHVERGEGVITRTDRETFSTISTTRRRQSAGVVGSATPPDALWSRPGLFSGGRSVGRRAAALPGELASSLDPDRLARVVAGVRAR